MDETRPQDEPGADELLRRALVDEDETAAVALQVRGLPLSETVTVIFHGRRDLATLQTYVSPGGHGAGSAVRADELLRVPCDLDLAEAGDRAEAEHLYAEQARAFRDALVGADTVLSVWAEPLEELAEGDVAIDRRVALDVSLPAHRLLPIALVAPERSLVVAPVCEARTLAEGRPPMGIACAQQGVTRIYSLPDDPERCLEDFFEVAADHAHDLADRLDHQEASVERFLELNESDEDDFLETG
jgi:hypothetical protein